jgi:hypothetical protein
MFNRRNRPSDASLIDTKDAIGEAFKAIRRDRSGSRPSEKICARQNFSCCGGCACYELGEFISTRPQYRGAVYYHRQDLQSFYATGEMYIGFSSRQDEGDAAMIAIGNAAAKAFRAAGLDVVWDGSASTRILVRALPPVTAEKVAS